MISENFFYLYVLFFAFYGLLIVPFSCSKVLVKFGNNERFWFVVVALFNVFSLLFFLISNRFRKGLTKKEVFIFLSFISGYCLFLSIVFFLE